MGERKDELERARAGYAIDAQANKPHKKKINFRNGPGTAASAEEKLRWDGDWKSLEGNFLMQMDVSLTPSFKRGPVSSCLITAGDKIGIRGNPLTDIAG
jgi:hypothetical protein